MPASAVAASLSEPVLEQAEILRDQALQDGTAYDYLERLTTEIGPRLAGTAEEARARDWSVAALKALGFSKKSIRIEPFDMQTWVRGQETAAIIAPYPQPLVITALGNSGSTGDKPLVGEVAVFETIDAVEQLPADALRGKIAYVDHAMGKTQDGSSYSYFGKARFKGPSIAASKGASGFMVRSIGTHSHRLPHTGGTKWEEGQAWIPAVALSPPDADQIERIAARGETVRVTMTVTPRVIGTTRSANIVVDIPGTDLADEIIITGGHLDSWDLGTGAIDDGAGVAITTAAVNLIRKSGKRPRRTIRLVHWGAEEVGLLGAKAYAAAHADTLGNHMLGSESDFGAERIFAIHADVSEPGQAVVDAMIRLLAPIGVGEGREDYSGSSGPDLSPLNDAGLPRFRLAQDGRDYFDLHHTPDDTFDKVDPVALRQNVAAYAVFLWLAANTDVDFRKPDAPDDSVQ